MNQEKQENREKRGEKRHAGGWRVTEKKDCLLSSAQAENQCLSLEVLLGRTCGIRGVAAPLEQRHAGVRVPAVVAPHPRHFRRKGGHQVVDGPCDDRIIIHCHVQVREADRVPDPWSQS